MSAIQPPEAGRVALPKRPFSNLASTSNKKFYITKEIFFYNGDEFAAWNGDLIVSSLKYKMLIKLEFEEGKVINRVIILKDKIGRVRDVDINSKGEIFLISDEKNSGLWKLKSN